MVSFFTPARSVLLAVSFVLLKSEEITPSAKNKYHY
jgi:hypothetical protein